MGHILTIAVSLDVAGPPLATYRDLRLCVGLQHFEGKKCTALEIGYLFDRHLEYASGNGDFRPADTAVIRIVTSY